MHLPSRRLAALLTVPLVLLAACGTEEGAGENPPTTEETTPAEDPAAAPETTQASGVEAATEPVVATDLGVEVTGEFGDKPAVTIPDEDPPGELAVEVLQEGDGEEVTDGDFVLVDYLGQTWAPAEDGAANVFDNSYDRGTPFGTAIGSGSVIQGWDEGLQGVPVGSRVLLVIPPAMAYGEEANAGNELGGQTLAFVVDVVDTYDADAAASGTPTDLPEGYPEVDSEPGVEPSFTSADGVEPGSEPRSALAIEGDGEDIDRERTLLVQVVATTMDLAEQDSSFGRGLQQVPAAQVLQLADALDGAAVGSRAVVLLPGTEATDGAEASGGEMLFIDVVGQI